MQGFISEIRKKAASLAVLSATACAALPLFGAGRPANHVVRAELPPPLAISPVSRETEPLALVPAARHSRELVDENSGLENCSTAPGAFWTLNDSGGEPRLFAIRADGSLVAPEGAGAAYRGVLLTGRRNVDWEAVAADGAGNLVVADIGNNESRRRNLCFYVVPEPSPLAEKTAASRKISFYYPTQDAFPDPSLNYDAESCFALNGFIYWFTKHWTDTGTVLWRVDPTTERYQAAVPVARFDVGGLVTDAALSPSRSRLAVLTYHSIWVFELPEKDASGARDETRFFTGVSRRRKIAAPVRDWQVEGVAFIDEDTLLVSAESGALFRVPISEIK